MMAKTEAPGGRADRAVVVLESLPVVLTDGDLRRLCQVGKTTWWKWKRAGNVPTRIASSSARNPRYARSVVLDWLEVGR